MSTVWAQRREELLSDCLVSPDVFHPDGGSSGRVRRALSTRAGDRGRPTQRAPLPPGTAVPLARQECRGHRDVRRCRATGHPRLHRHRPMGSSPVDRGVGRLKWPIGWASPMASSPSIRAVSPNAARTRWGSSASGVATGARSTTARSACSWATSVATTMPCSTSACPCPRSGHGTSNDARHATCHQRCAITRATSSAWRCSTRGGSRCRTAGSPVMMSWVATRGFARSCASAVSAMCWGCPAPPRCATWRRRCPRTQGVDGGPKPRGNR